MKFTALLHILSMASLLGLLVPEIMLGRQYRKSSAPAEKLALARYHMKIARFSYALLLFVVLTGAARVMEQGYPWFAFDTMLWLALKQIIALLLCVWVVATWSSLLQVAKKLRSEVSLEAESNAVLKAYERIKGRSHLVTGMAWLLAALAILKP